MLLQHCRDLPAYLTEIAFKEDAGTPEILTIALAFALLWALFFPAGRCLLRHLTHDRPRLRAMCEREYDHHAREIEAYIKKAGFLMSRDDVVGLRMWEWPNDKVIIVQHLAGAFLCLPSLLGLGDPSRASSLAAWGILSEVGFSIMDTTERLYTRFFNENGSKKVPDSALIFTVIHHCIAMGLGIPAVLHYRKLKFIHWLCFDLNIAASAALLKEYCKVLDISRPDHLRRFKVVNFLLLALYLWTMLIHWTYLCIEVALVWCHEKAWTFLAFGSVSIAFFSFFNMSFCVTPTYKRFMKFLDVSAEHTSLPPDTSPAKRRQSNIKLWEAASDLSSVGMEDRVQPFLDSFEERVKIDRRRTVPPRRRVSWASKSVMHLLSAPEHRWKEK